MERIIFDRMAALDQTHWWYIARRKILSDTIKRLELDVSLDLVTGRDLEIARARLSMLSLERPQGRIHPALGILIAAGIESAARAKAGPGEATVAAASSSS